LSCQPDDIPSNGAFPLFRRLGELSYVLVVGLAAAAANAQVTDEDASWVARNCGTISRYILDDSAFKEEAEDYPIVSVEIGGEYVLPTKITIISTGDHLRVRLVQPKGRTICDQLLRARVLNKELTLQSARGVIATTISERGEEEIPGLRKHLKRLLSMRAHFSLNDSIFLPGRSYSIEIESLTEKLALDFSIPEPLADSAAFSGTPRPSQPQASRWLTRLVQILGVDLEAGPAFSG